MYTRIINAGGMKIVQFIGFGLVLSLSKNINWSNGDVHGWKFSIQNRATTNL